MAGLHLHCERNDTLVTITTTYHDIQLTGGGSSGRWVWSQTIRKSCWLDIQSQKQSAGVRAREYSSEVLPITTIERQRQSLESE